MGRIDPSRDRRVRKIVSLRQQQKINPKRRNNLANHVLRVSIPNLLGDLNREFLGRLLHVEVERREDLRAEAVLRQDRGLARRLRDPDPIPDKEL